MMGRNTHHVWQSDQPVLQEECTELCLPMNLTRIMKGVVYTQQIVKYLCTNERRIRKCSPFLWPKVKPRIILSCNIIEGAGVYSKYA